jgi:hypothetical protein
MRTSALARLARRARTVAGVTIMFTLLQTAPAEAHNVYTYRQVGATGNFCMMGYSEINHGDTSWGGGSWASVQVQTYNADPGHFPCYWRGPNWVYQHAMLVVVWFWDYAYGGSWQPCFGTPWEIQSAKSHSWMNYRVDVACGATWYGTDGYTFARNGNNDPWIGEIVWSGDQFLDR